MKNLLLIGGSGQLGSEIVRRWNDFEIVAPAHSELALGDAASFARALDEHRPSLVVNCAAFHNVDRCEDEPARAFDENAVAVFKMASACAQHDIRFVTLSTDYVFSGESEVPYDEDATPSPISVYGTSKFAGEILARQACGNALIVRTCGLYGLRPSSTKGYTFVDRVLAQAKAGEHLRIVNDVVASPTYAGDLALALGRLIEAGAKGIYHVVNSGAVTWYDFACYALEAAGIRASIEPVPQSTWPGRARRPRYSALTSKRLSALQIFPADWKSGIDSYLADKGAETPLL